jgi:predicted RNA binding protein with dsRBD fold (UPF0201 family)
MPEEDKSKTPAEIVAESIASELIESKLASQQVIDTIKSHLLSGTQNKTAWLKVIKSAIAVNSQDSQGAASNETPKTQNEA